jgi:hypothetical protein
MRLDRKCIKCDAEFQLKPTEKASNICVPCKRLYQRKYANKKSKVILEGKKEKYPIPDNERRAKFVKIQKELAKIKDRAEWIMYMIDKLDNLDPLILKWIWDRRDHNTLDEDRNSRHTKESYDDTRTTHNNNKSWFD